MFRASHLLAMALGAVALTQSPKADALSVIAFARFENWRQVGVDTFTRNEFSPNFEFEFFVSLEDVSIQDVSLNGSPLEGEGGEWEIREGFDTRTELNDTWGAGTYSLSGSRPIQNGDFSIDLQVPDYVPPQRLKINNWAELQNADPTKDIVVKFTPFTAVADEVIIEFTIGYVTEVNGAPIFMEDLWSSDALDLRDDGLPGLPADATSFTIPANTLVGSSYNHFEVNLWMSELTEAGEPPSFAPDALVVAARETDLSFTIFTNPNIPNESTYLDRYPLREDNWANTGNWFGWLWVERSPWIFSYALNRYLYIAEASVSASGGAWIYIPAPDVVTGSPNDYLGVWPIRDDSWTNTGDWLGWLWVGSRPWVFVPTLNRYLYISENSFASGGWIYVPGV